jgi:hypothetical protein
MKKILFLFIMLVLWFPIIQENFHIINFSKLSGVTIPPKKPLLNRHEWFEGSFQGNYEGYKVNNFGGRNFLIKLFNQFDYSIFRHSSSGIIIGKNDFLYENNYLTEISGISYRGEDYIKQELNDLYEIQQYLASRNIVLVTLLAPGKSYYYSEYIPNYYKNKSGSETNYKSIIRNASRMNLNLIDANSWFIKMKDSTHYPLFPKQGIHWNTYGMGLVVDSLVKYLQARLNVDLSEVKVSLEFPNELTGTDNDLGDVLNLLFKRKNPLMPSAKFDIDTLHKKKPRLLSVGDSFYWTIFNSGVFHHIFSNMHYYYYNHTIYGSEGEHMEVPADYNLLRELNNYDIVLLIQSSPNYEKIGGGFVKLLKDNIKQHKDLVSKYMMRIKEDNTFQELATNYSVRNKVSADSSLNFISDSFATAYMDEISKIKIEMRANPQWLAQIEEKSKTWNVTLEDAMERDAEWMMSQKKMSDKK